MDVPPSDGAAMREHTEVLQRTTDKDVADSHAGKRNHMLAVSKLLTTLGSACFGAGA
jgi:hypothetical protein